MYTNPYIKESTRVRKAISYITLSWHMCITLLSSFFIVWKCNFPWHNTVSPDPILLAYSNSVPALIDLLTPHLLPKQCISLLCGLGTIPQMVYELITQISWKTFCFNFAFTNMIRSWYCTCHDSSAVVPCAKLWLDFMSIFAAKQYIFVQDLDY